MNRAGLDEDTEDDSGPDGLDQGVLLPTLEASDSGWRVTAQDDDGAVVRPASTAGVTIGG